MRDTRHPLSIDLAEVDGARIVTAHGYVDLSTRLKLSTALNEALTRGTGPVLVDLEAVNFMDSTGLGVLLGSERRLRERGRRLAVVCPPGAVRAIFDISGIDEVMPVEDTRLAALARVTEAVPPQ